MPRRQTVIPRQWLIVDSRSDEGLCTAIRRMPRGSAILVLHFDLAPGDRQRLLRRVRQLARGRRLLVVDGATREAVRVHDARELARARLGGARLLLLSPLFPTRSHPDWPAMPKMRAAALARLTRGPLLALGGMDQKRFAQVRALGFHGWAGIDAWRKEKPKT